MQLSRFDLHEGWMFRQVDDAEGDPWLPARKLPTQVHLDLLENKKIPDPFLDLNELAVRWVGEQSWVYKTHFKNPLTQPMNDTATTDLVFDGLDTFTTVRLNGVDILKTENMFQSHRVDISRYLRDDNTLEIEFDSTLSRGRKLLNEHGHEHTFYVRQTEMSRVPVRSAQYNWGWDWGPITLTLGPWKPIYLEQYVSRIDDIWVQYQISHDMGTVSGTIFATVPRSSSGTVNLSISLEGSNIIEKDCEVDSDGQVKTDFEIENPNLWNPFGYGQQTLYEIKATIQGHDEKSKRIGFRRVELIQQPDEYGKSFYFRINGVDVFCGGSCWIPADSFLSRLTPEKYRKWMELIKSGNQIMVRIWGGGIYEHDALYDACDELGILVWQDFAFACASYPTYPTFLDSVEQEARQNMRRLRSHPSLIIWAGSNEDYQVQERYGLEYNYEDKDPQSWLKSTFPARYLYEYLLPKIVSEEDPAVAYHPTSPWGDGKNSADPTVGDKHQWDLWHGAMRRYQEAPELSARFVSEFGMEAYPHLETIQKSITDPQQRYPGSRMMDFRNKAIDHERRMITYVAENFIIKYDLSSYTHLTQVVQSEVMKYAYESWRREWGTRKCGGVLVWQLNDCWPTMSWAVVDYYLIKKPSFYAISRAMKPLAVGISKRFHSWTAGHDDPRAAANDTSFDLWIANSRTDSVELDLRVRFISVESGQDLAAPLEQKVTAQPNGTTELLKDYPGPEAHLALDSSDPSSLISYNPYIIYATISLNDAVVAANAEWPQPIKYLNLGPRTITFRAVSENRLSLSCELPVKGFVIEETQFTSLSDNGFDMVPEEVKEIDVSGVSLSSLRYTYIGAPEGSMNIQLST